MTINKTQWIHLATARARIPMLDSGGGTDEWPTGTVTLIFTST